MRLLRRGPGLALAAFVVAALPVGRAAACTDLAQAPTTRWSLTTKDGVSWLVTPCGQRFLSLGVNALDGGYPYREKAGKVYYSWTAFAPSEEAWVEATRRRLAAWGFNSAGGWALPPQELRLPTDRQSRARPPRALSLVRPVRARDRDADDGARPQARRALSQYPLSDRLFLRQRGRLVGRRAVCLLFDEAGRFGDQAALGRDPAAPLWRRLGALHRRFCAAARASVRGPRCSPRPG